MEKIFILLSAAFGGISPNLLDLGISLTKGGTLPGWTYLIGLVIFAILGAGVAVIWKETDLKKAFYLGIGLPAFIQLSVSSVSQQNYAMHSFDKTSMFAFVSIANAQDSDKKIEGRKITIVPNQSTTQYGVVFSSRDGSKKVLQEIDTPGAKTIGVPDFASSIAIQKGASKSIEKKLPMEPNTSATIEVNTEKKTWSGLLQSIGVRKAPAYNIDLKTLPKKPVEEQDQIQD
jgi:hypothetical protein